MGISKTTRSNISRPFQSISARVVAERCMHCSLAGSWGFGTLVSRKAGRLLNKLHTVYCNKSKYHKTFPTRCPQYEHGAHSMFAVVVQLECRATHSPTIPTHVRGNPGIAYPVKELISSKSHIGKESCLTWFDRQHPWGHASPSASQYT